MNKMAVLHFGQLAEEINLYQLSFLTTTVRSEYLVLVKVRDASLDLN